MPELFQPVPTGAKGQAILHCGPGVRAMPAMAEGARLLCMDCGSDSLAEGAGRCKGCAGVILARLWRGLGRQPPSSGKFAT